MGWDIKDALDRIGISSCLTKFVEHLGEYYEATMMQLLHKIICSLKSSFPILSRGAADVIKVICTGLHTGKIHCSSAQDSKGRGGLCTMR